MSLYNMLNGVKPSTFFILPMLGRHPEAYPRFRDCFLDDEAHPLYENHIHVYTRMGGNNSDCWGVADYEQTAEGCSCPACTLDRIEQTDPNFVISFDDDNDSTFRTSVFSVPDKWVKDFKLLLEGKMQDTSPEYLEMIKKVFPKLEEKFDAMFAKAREQGKAKVEEE